MDKENIIGKGTFGTVYSDGKDTAVKVFEYLCEFITELYYTAMFSHPNLIALKSFGLDDNSITMERGICDLSKFEEYNFSNEDYKNIFYQILCGMQHIHNRGLMHCDIKPANVVLFKDKKVKLIDFGSCTKNGSFLQISQFFNAAYTLQYRAPEIFETFHYNEKADSWALGCTFYEILKKKPLLEIPPFNSEAYNLMFPPDSDKSDIILNIINTTLENKELIENDGLLDDLLRKLLRKNPEERISITDALDHDYFEGVDGDLRLSREVSLTPLEILKKYNYVSNKERGNKTKNIVGKVYKNLFSVEKYYSADFVIATMQIFDKFLNQPSYKKIKTFHVFLNSLDIANSIYGHEESAETFVKNHSNEKCIKIKKKILNMIINNKFHTLSTDFVQYYGKKYHSKISRAASKLCADFCFIHETWNLDNETLALLAINMACDMNGVEYISEKGQVSEEVKSIIINKVKELTLV